MDETEKLIDFLNKKIDDLRVDVRFDMAAIVEKLDLYADHPEICREKLEEKFVIKKTFNLFVIASVAGFILLLSLDMYLHPMESIVKVAPKAIIGAIK